MNDAKPNICKCGHRLESTHSMLERGGWKCYVPGCPCKKFEPKK